MWLDPKRTSPYEYYQYWINTEDDDVERFLSLFTFLSMKEIRQLGKLSGADKREAKQRLAFETLLIAKLLLVILTICLKIPTCIITLVYLCKNALYSNTVTSKNYQANIKTKL